MLVSLEWNAAQWDLRGRFSPASASLELKEGISAYAAEQAVLQRTLAGSFGALWKTPLADVDDLFLPGTFMDPEGSECDNNSDSESCSSDDEEMPEDTD